jgi:hypothetical protein
MYTYLILGHIHSMSETVDITFNINDTILYSGKLAVPISEPDPDTGLTELYKWNTDSPLQGDLAVSGSIAGGTLVFAMFAKSTIAKYARNGQLLDELEYPDSQFNQHAVTNLIINDVVQPVPTNIIKPGDLRGWRYLIPNDSVFRFNYFAGPFADNV